MTKYYLKPKEQNKLIRTLAPDFAAHDISPDLRKLIEKFYFSIREFLFELKEKSKILPDRQRAFISHYDGKFNHTLALFKLYRWRIIHQK